MLDLAGRRLPRRSLELVPRRLALGGAARFRRRPLVPKTRGLVDTSPLWGLLRRVLDADINDEIPWVEENLEAGRLLAARSTIDWSTGRTIFWVQGRGSSRGGARSAAASRPGSRSIT